VNIQPFLFGDGWIEVKDGNDTARALFEAHYSRREYADGRRPKLIVGPGEKLLLLSANSDALCAWRSEVHRRDGQVGVNCAIFRRNGGDPASVQLAAARELAWRRWPGRRLFTFVNHRKVKPTIVRGHPVWGWCFYKDGWSFAGLTGTGLHILERVP